MRDADVFAKLIKYILIVPLLLIAACSMGPQVFHDRDPSQDYSSYMSFTWAANPPLIKSGEYPVSSLVEKRMTAAIRTALENKGYSFSKSKSGADFLVSYTMGARDKIEVREYPDLFHDSYLDWEWGRPYFGPGYLPPLSRGWPRETRTEIDEFAQGTLSVDIFDLKRRSPVWHAQASKRLTQQDLNGQTTTDFTEAATTIIESFPTRN